MGNPPFFCVYDSCEMSFALALVIGRLKAYPTRIVVQLTARVMLENIYVL